MSPHATSSPNSDRYIAQKIIKTCLSSHFPLASLFLPSQRSSFTRTSFLIAVQSSCSSCKLYLALQRAFLVADLYLQQNFLASSKPSEALITRLFVELRCLPHTSFKHNSSARMPQVSFRPSVLASSTFSQDMARAIESSRQPKYTSSFDKSSKFDQPPPPPPSPVGWKRRDGTLRDH